MASKLWMVGRMVIIAVGSLLAFCSGAWAALALWYRLPGGKAARTLGSVAWVVFVLAIATLVVRQPGWKPLGVYAAAYALLLLWWAGIAPSGRRDWRDDVARLLSGTVHGDRVRLDNVRNFAWRSDADYDVRWESRTYDLARLVGADAVVSHWGSRAIAHAMITFGFDDGRHLAFSVEVRKSRDQQYSSIGGFFKQFETILVAADENDIIRVRTNIRGEDVYLYPLRLDQPVLQALFLSYVHAANQLAAQPAFYNTFTSNCTTIVYRMGRQIDPGLPWDIRLLLTGYLPEYLQRVGAVDRSVPVETLRKRSRISELAKATTAGAGFSSTIRKAGQAS